MKSLSHNLKRFLFISAEATSERKEYVPKSTKSSFFDLSFTNEAGSNDYRFYRKLSYKSIIQKYLISDHTIKSNHSDLSSVEKKCNIAITLVKITQNAEFFHSVF